MRRWLMNLGILAAAIGPVAAAEPVALHGGDRVVLIGGTLVEREAESGYLETRIARRLPGQAVVVRNLGWSGDTVEGVSHGKLNPARDGFRELVDHVAALRPTVVVLGYGANESYNGTGGLPVNGVRDEDGWTWRTCSRERTRNISTWSHRVCIVNSPHMSLIEAGRRMGIAYRWRSP